MNRRLLLCVALIGLFPALMCAQVDTGTIVGTVRDATGAVLPGANVVVSAVGTGVNTTVKTAADGTYVATPLKIGEYTISVEAAGFKARRHEEHVGPGFHEVGQLVVESHHHSKFPLIFGGFRRQPAVIALFAGAQDHHHEVQGHELGQHLGHQVEALLVRQTGDHGQDGGLGQFLVEPESLHQGRLVGGLALGIMASRAGALEDTSAEPAE